MHYLGESTHARGKDIPFVKPSLSGYSAAVEGNSPVGGATLFTKDFSPLAGKRVSAVSHTTVIFSRVIITMSAGASGRSLFSNGREVQLITRTLHSFPRIHIIHRAKKLAVRVTESINTYTLLQKIQGMGSFRCRRDVTSVGGLRTPSLRAIVLLSSRGCHCLDSDLVGRITVFNKSMSALIPTGVGTTVLRGFRSDTFGNGGVSR